MGQQKAFKKISPEIPDTKEGIELYIKYADKELRETEAHAKRIEQLIKMAHQKLGGG